MMDRRDFMKSSAMTAAGISLFPAGCASEFVAPPPPLFKVSLAQWSLHKALFANEMTNLEFPVIAREAFAVYELCRDPSPQDHASPPHS